MTAGRPRVPAPGRGRRSWAKLGAGRGPGLGAAVLPPGRGLAGRDGHGRGGFSPGVHQPRCPAFLLKKKRKKKSPPRPGGCSRPARAVQQPRSCYGMRAVGAGRGRSRRGEPRLRGRVRRCSPGRGSASGSQRRLSALKRAFNLADVNYSSS